MWRNFSRLISNSIFVRESAEPALKTSGAAADDNPSRHDENRDAVAAGIQNMLLGATALGLATYWGTAPLIDSRRVLDLCGFEPDVRIVNVMYLGWARDAPEGPARPPVHLAVIES